MLLLLLLLLLLFVVVVVVDMGSAVGCISAVLHSLAVATGPAGRHVSVLVVPDAEGISALLLWAAVLVYVAFEPTHPHTAKLLAVAVVVVVVVVFVVVELAVVVVLAAAAIVVVVVVVVVIVAVIVVAATSFSARDASA